MRFIIKEKLIFVDKFTKIIIVISRMQKSIINVDNDNKKTNNS